MRTGKKHPLIGRMVAVHPFANGDALDKQGEVGKIIAGYGKDIVRVQFRDGLENLYYHEQLLTLNPKSVILQGLQSNKMTEANKKAVMAVYRRVTQKNLDEALMLAMKNDATRFLCTTTCKDWLDMKREQQKNKQNKLRKQQP